MRRPNLSAILGLLNRWPGGGLDALPDSQALIRNQVIDESIFHDSLQTIAERRRLLAPEAESAFREFSRRVFADGALPAETKELIAVAVAHVTQCPDCIRGHTRAAQRHGATGQEIMEAIWVAAEMRAGAAYAHSKIALETLKHATA